MISPYDVYKTFKTVESQVKKKTLRLKPIETWDSRLSDENKNAIKWAAGMFNTIYSNIDLDEYIRCGFSLYSSFDYEKMFRENIIKEYIARDSRKKRNSKNTIKEVMDTIKFIDMDISDYLMIRVGQERRIIYDYIHNNICSAVIVWCIWRQIFVPTDVEWEYLNVIKNNWPVFEKNMIPYAPMLDKWRKHHKEKK